MVRAQSSSGRESGLCPLYHHAVELIGRRWTGAIIFVLLRGTCRFSDLRAAIPDITDRMLSERLKELEQEGIVQRHVVPETPVRVEYALSDRGRALAHPVEALAAWAQEWLPAADATAGAAVRKGAETNQTVREPGQEIR